MTERPFPGDEALAQIAEMLGKEATLRLARHFGGIRLYVPRKIGDHHPICVAIGRADADRLSAWAGGGSLDIPKQAARRAHVIQLHTAGALTKSQIALETGYTERHVYRLVRDADDSNQPSLF